MKLLGKILIWLCVAPIVAVAYLFEEERYLKHINKKSDAPTSDEHNNNQ